MCLFVQHMSFACGQIIDNMAVKVKRITEQMPALENFEIVPSSHKAGKFRSLTQPISCIYSGWPNAQFLTSSVTVFRTVSWVVQQLSVALKGCSHIMHACRSSGVLLNAKRICTNCQKCRMYAK